jgi:hypothetical protein
VERGIQRSKILNPFKAKKTWDGTGIENDLGYTSSFKKIVAGFTPKKWGCTCTPKTIEIS